ncbi:hypothetical protein D3C72_2273840 [compost metagenome]
MIIQGALIDEGLTHIEGPRLLLQLEQHIIQVARLQARGLDKLEQLAPQALPHPSPGFEYRYRHYLVRSHLHL